MFHAHDTNIALLEVSDVSGQKSATVSDVPPDASIGDLVEHLLAELNLTRNDASGRPLTYHARLEREGRHLQASERIGEALLSGDRLVLQPNIDAGGSRT
jgi:hypothetical protein